LSDTEYPNIEDGGSGSFRQPLATRALIFEPANNRQIAWLDTPIWPRLQSVIELPHPEPHDAIVIGVRMAVDPPSPGATSPRYATIFIDVEFLPPGELIDRRGFVPE
jgi:hypothetical protein